MTIEEARSTISNDGATFQDWVLAAAVLSSAKESSLEDIIGCLKRRGLPAEMAATALYARTRRPQATDSIESLIMEPEDWRNYVRRMQCRS
jgi:hypothetical protein